MSSNTTRWDVLVKKVAVRVRTVYRTVAPWPTDEHDPCEHQRDHRETTS
jgi:hypothetical protein